jgi:hypothetical protein
MKELPIGMNKEVKTLSTVSNDVLNTVKHSCPDNYGLLDHCTQVGNIKLFNCIACWEQALDEIE